MKIVVGGYDPSLACEAYLCMPVDFIVRGEGEVTFRELTRALDKGCNPHFISGLSHRCSDTWIHNQLRAPHRLEDDEIQLPNRSARVLKGYTILGRQVDVVETSRGCTYDNGTVCTGSMRRLMGLPYLHQATRVWGHPYGLQVSIMG